MIDRNHCHLAVVRSISYCKLEAPYRSNSQVFELLAKSLRLAPQLFEEFLDTEQEIRAHTLSAAFAPDTTRNQVGLGQRIDDQRQAHDAPPTSRALTSSHGEPAFGSSRNSSKRR